MAETLFFPDEDAAKLQSYLPEVCSATETTTTAAAATTARPFVTLTFATSLDSALALAPGQRTALSGPRSKAMTHYLRSRHDAICIGVGTAVADDPGLNCRLAASGSNGSSSSSSSGGSSGNSKNRLDGSQTAFSAHQPRPIVLDPHDRWPLSHDSRILAAVRRGQGLAPYIITSVRTPDAEKRSLLEAHGGKYIVSDSASASGEQESGRLRWEAILDSIAGHGLRSVMIEGGGNVINSLLAPAHSHLVDSVIVTIAPTWLGQGSVSVCPDRVCDADNQPVPAARLTNTRWHQLGEDVILCGRFRR